MRLFQVCLTLSLLPVLALAGCSNERPVLTPAPADTVRIVSSLPARGLAAAQSRDISRAISLAIEERGGIAGGLRVEYVKLDDDSGETGEWSRAKELENATLAADDPSVVAYVGPYNSGAAALSLLVTNRAGLLQASPSATWPGLTLSGWDPGEPERYFPTGERNFVRMMPPDSVEAEAAARWAADLGHKSVAVVQDGSTYSNGLADVFVRSAASLSVTVNVRLEVGIAAFGDQARALGGATAVFYAPSSVGNAAKVARTLAPSGLPVFATDTVLDDRFINEVGDAGTRWLVVSNSAQAGPSEKYASPPTIGASGETFTGQFAANAYAITELILDGIASGTGHDRAALSKSVRSAVSGGRSGGRLFNEAGDPNSWVVSGYKWEGGSFLFDRAFTSGP